MTRQGAFPPGFVLNWNNTMITSLQPWSLLTEGEFTYILDMKGSRIAKFKDWQDAEFTLKAINDQFEEIETLNAENSKLEDEIETFKEELATIERIRKQKEENKQL